jgi:hypothetical protein
MYIKTVDKFNEYNINCMITPGSKYYINLIFLKRDEIFIYT